LNEQPGKLAMRSQEWIQTALFQLMEKKEYSHISITEIAERAGLARQTLYRNFHDKDEILLSYLTEFMRGMWQHVEKRPPFDKEMFIELFHNWKLHAPSSLIHNIVTKDRKIRQLIYKSICDYFDSLFDNLNQEAEGKLSDTYRIYSHKSLSSIVHLMLIEWTLNDFHLTPEEIGRLVSDLTVSIRAYM
jgi:AcrR family transcriptional regulator